MRRYLFTALVAGLAWWGIASNATWAQSWQLGTYGPPQVRVRPTISPYINIAGRTTNIAVDYYGIVRPQMDASRSIGALQQGYSSLLNEGNTQSGVAPQTMVSGLGGLQTGHATSFFNYQNYFPLSYGSTGNSTTGSIIGSSGLNTMPVRPFFSNNLNAFQVR